MKNKKDWIGNQTSIITGGFHNKSKHTRQAVDFYATSPEALEKLLQYEKFYNVWECSCGLGHLSEVLKKHGILGKASDLIDRGYGEAPVDFLQVKANWNGDILTNPPYRIAVRFIYHGLSILDTGNRLAMLFPQRYLSSKTRYKLFTEYPPQVIYAFSGRISCALNGDFSAHSNSAVDYMWIIWKKGYKGKTILRWIL